MSLAGAPAASSTARRRRIKGTTMSFEIMIDRATVATMTMAVAAESPPMKANIVRGGLPMAMGRAST